MKDRKQIVYGAVLLACLVVSRVFGVQGKLVLFGVFASGAAVLMLGAGLVILYAKNDKGLRKGALAALLAGMLLTGYGLYVESGVVLDLAGGPKTETLYSCEATHGGNPHGVLNPNYSLAGKTAAGESIRFPLSLASWTELKDCRTVTVEYYPYTMRIRTYGAY